MFRLDLQRQLYDMLMRSQYWSEERMQEHQRGQLEHLLRHARANVPFYAERLSGVFRADGEIDWDRWGEIPVVTRQDLQDSHEAMQARDIPAGHGATTQAQSSGSTGRPIVTTQNELTAMAASVAGARSYAWHGIDISRTHVCIFGDDPGEGRYPDGLLHEPWGPPVMWGDTPGRQYDLNLAATPDQALEFITRHRPSYLSGLVTRVSVLAHEARRLGIAIKADAVLPFGEAVGPAQRQLFHDAFGARTIPIYSSQETYRIAHACPEHDHFHVNAELMLVEILDEHGLPVAPGETGRVVITPFYNTAQPLIRYQIGDLAMRGAACSCGRTLPVVAGIVGRIAHMFVLPGGRRVLPNVSDQDVLDLGARIWQLAQTGPHELEFRYVPGLGGGGDEAVFAERMKVQLHPEFNVSFRRLSMAHFQGRRKYVPYVCELPPING